MILIEKARIFRGKNFRKKIVKKCLKVKSVTNWKKKLKVLKNARPVKSNFAEISKMPTAVDVR